MFKWMNQHMAPAVTICLLAGVLGDRMLFHRPSADAEPYHRQVRESAARVPMHVDSWLGQEAVVPPSAVALLKPNVLMARRYEDIHSGQQITFLLVQCRDARDLLGHYPPVCYPAHGWVLRSQEQKDWQVGYLLIQGMEYQFSIYNSKRSGWIVIDNFMILPGNSMCRDMEGIKAVAKDRRRHQYGAAQIQFVSDGAVSAGEREKAVKKLIEANRSLIDSIRVGVQP